MAGETIAEKLTPRGLERRIKRHLTSPHHTFAAITTPGFESIAMGEISKLEGAAVKGCENGIVEFSGPFDLLYRANLSLRTVNRIILRIDELTARSYPELYNKFRRIRWDLYVGFSTTVSFVVSSRSSRLHHTDHIARTAFCSCADTMATFGVNLTESGNSDLKFHIRFLGDRCTLSIDTTGMLLYKRGYRQAVGRAPLRETSAAALLIAASWERYHTIVDFCCGSGSIVLEALQMACSRAPGLDRSFPFSGWPSFNAPLWNRMKKEAFAAVTESRVSRFLAMDIESSALDMVRLNCPQGDTGGTVLMEQGDCCTFNSSGQYGNSGLIISNLPFGKRVGAGEEGTAVFYRKLGHNLKKSCRGWNFGFLVADSRFERLSGLSCSTALTFSNGGIRVRFVTGRVEPDG